MNSSRRKSRVAYGDWQTPPELADAVVSRLSKLAIRFASLLEPTCGDGSLLNAACKTFPQATAHGFEIEPGHVANARKLLAGKANIRQADFFELDWQTELRDLPEPLLIIGNPPWVTNAALSKLGSGNLPQKSNSDGLTGLDALTGRSNFDISEWMLRRLLEAAVHKQFVMAMLCKSQVARKIMQHVAAETLPLRGTTFGIDSKRHFDASVDAVLLVVSSSELKIPGDQKTGWPVFDNLQAGKPARSMGVVDGRTYSDLGAFNATNHLQGECDPQWRSGLKHDCARIMELTETPEGLLNGLGEIVEIEDAHTFPLLKGSDIANGRTQPTRQVIVPQTKLGEDTAKLQQTAPLTWQYLTKHANALSKRRSSIYRDQPAFAIFGIGDYSFAPFKVAICGLYKRLQFTLLKLHNGRPILVDDTVYFLPFKSLKAAETAGATLSSKEAKQFFEARVFWDAKRPVNKTLLQSLDLVKLA